MSRKKACKNCKRVYEGNNCPNCSSNETVSDFKGRVIIFNSEESEIAKNLGVKQKGEYAIKVR